MGKLENKKTSTEITGCDSEHQDEPTKDIKIFLSADLHGKALNYSGMVDGVFIIGDFAKGDKLREAVFGNGDIEKAKVEVLDSSKEFLKSLPKKSIIVPGNAEKICLEEISEMAKNMGHIFLENEVFYFNDLKIIGLKFFMEEEWVREVYPHNENKIKRSIEEEEEVINFLNSNPDADIVLSHLPPYKVLDYDPNAPKFVLDKYPKHGGSKTLLSYIKKNHPRLVVCGHIHVPGEFKIGKTTVINPGEGKIISI